MLLSSFIAWILSSRGWISNMVCNISTNEASSVGATGDLLSEIKELKFCPTIIITMKSLTIDYTITKQYLYF